MKFWIKSGDGKIQLAPYKGGIDGYEVVGSERLIETCIIPESYKGKPVVSIDNLAFKDRYILKELFIPDSVIYIYEGALNKLMSLEHVRVPLGTAPETLARILPENDMLKVFYGTSGFSRDNATEEEEDDGGKTLVEEEDVEEERVPEHTIYVCSPERDMYKVNQNKWRFRLMQWLKILAFFLPTIIAIIVPFDIFNAETGHYLNIVAKDSIGLGWTITLYVIYCIVALLVGICFTSEMLHKEKYIDRTTTEGTKPYKTAAMVIASISAIIIAFNLTYILPNIGKDKITFAGGNVNEIFYLHTSESIVLQEPVRDNDEYEDYYTKYTFKHWNINGQQYLAGEEYNPVGWERAEAEFEVVDYATLTISTSNAQIRVDYDQITDTRTSGDIEIALGTEVTLSVTYSYNNAKAFQVNSKDASNPYIFVMEKHTYAYAKSVSDGCLVEGTMVTLADGSQRAVEDLAVGDEVLIFNHLTGKLDTAPVFINAHAMQEAKEYDVVTLTFSGGETLEIVEEHAVFDKTDGKYAYINKHNAKSFIGHSFAAIKDGKIGESVLVDVAIDSRTTKIYNPVSDVHVNLVAGGLLTNSACTIDMFEYSEDMSYDKKAMERDIAEYGLYGYDVFEDYISYSAYESFPLRYYKVAVGKGLCTFEEVMVLIRYYLSDTTAR